MKIRGFRIELGEIEARLPSIPGCARRWCWRARTTPGEKRLVAYVVGGDGGASTRGAARRTWRAALPEYMVPAAFVRLDALPLTPNGKLDRKALPAPEGDASRGAAYEAPAGEAEEALAEIWARGAGRRAGRPPRQLLRAGRALAAGRAA